MLEEYCNSYETVRAAKSAASRMKRQVSELKEALLKTSLEIIQIEWMHDINANILPKRRLISHKYLSSDARFLPVLLISRRQLLENFQSSIAKISKALEGLQTCDRTSVTAGGQLERAMSWACGGASSTSGGNTSVRNPGIPQEFHDHLMRRQQLLCEVQEKASYVMNLWISILKFELSRDGFFQTSEEFYPSRSIADGRTWQQAYLNALTNLDISYHSFTRMSQIVCKKSDSDEKFAAKKIIQLEPPHIEFFPSKLCWRNLNLYVGLQTKGYSKVMDIKSTYKVTQPVVSKPDAEKIDEHSDTDSGGEMVDGILTSGIEFTFEILSQQELICSAFTDDDAEDEFEREKQDALNEKVPVMRIGSWEWVSAMLVHCGGGQNGTQSFTVMAPRRDVCPGPSFPFFSGLEQ
ncbi:hypothetical protein T459_29734 [Capsicum annuum]|uniref:Uncharacterized protein n=1 Tax=Capsicum annuum TaxID=4072 RepID=A0A2G2Y6J2_CAPAN|nr:hypothetical protein T459_29734 [Capsicum annuum]